MGSGVDGMGVAGGTRPGVVGRKPGVDGGNPGVGGGTPGVGGASKGTEAGAEVGTMPAN